MVAEAATLHCDWTMEKTWASAVGRGNQTFGNLTHVPLLMDKLNVMSLPQAKVYV